MELECINENNIHFLKILHLENFDLNYNENFYEKIVSKSAAGGYLAKYENRYVGEITFTYKATDERFILYIYTLSVIKDFRRLGIGSKLMDKIINEFDYAEKIKLHTEVTNFAAQKCTWEFIFFIFFFFYKFFDKFFNFVQKKKKKK